MHKRENEAIKNKVEEILADNSFNRGCLFLSLLVDIHGVSISVLTISILLQKFNLVEEEIQTHLTNKIYYTDVALILTEQSSSYFLFLRYPADKFEKRNDKFL